MAKSKNLSAADISDSTRESPTVIFDSGQVRMGSMSPAFASVRGKAVDTSDTGTMRIGSMSPSFPGPRTK